MWFFTVFFALFIVGMPLLLFWAWQGRFLPKNRQGIRLEVLREQTAHLTKKILPAWLMIVLVEADHIIRLYPVSHDFRLIWLGFFSASWLFTVAFVVINSVAFVREEREKRRQKPEQASS